LLFVLLTAATAVTAAPIGFMASLSGPGEEPPNTSPGTGFTNVIIDDATDMLWISAVFSGLEGLTTAAHIHVINGPGDTNTGDTVGPVATVVPSFPGFPSGVSSGSYLESFDMSQAGSYNPSFVTAAGSVSAAQQALFDAIMNGRAYLNIHSTVYPGGEIRGFLAPVPEPATMCLLGASIVGLSLIRRRRNISR
jgi:hypothetical protein